MTRVRDRIGVGLLAAAFAFLVGAIIVAQWSGEQSLADPDNAAQVARGKPIYDRLCASCHGARLEGQPGVGSETDMFLLGPQPATYHSMRRSVINDVAKIYEDNLKESKRVYDRTEREVDEYLTKLAQTPAKPEEQKAPPPSTDGTPSPNGEKTSGAACSEDGKEKP